MRRLAAIILLPALAAAQPQTHHAPDTSARARSLFAGIASPFVPNLGQWTHPGKFVYRSGPMTLFLQDRGWVIDLVEHPVRHEPGMHGPASFATRRAIHGRSDVEQKRRGVALQMAFEGDDRVPEIVGEKRLPGHHSYFLGNDQSRWRTDVPLYGSIRYTNLYPGIDLRLREANGVPEYDLLLRSDADLSRVIVHVEGAQQLSIARDGSLVIETALGPLTQPRPETWQVGEDGERREVICNFTLIGENRFGFETNGWDPGSNLTIDLGLIWSTFLSGSDLDFAYALSVDASGVVTVGGRASATNFPITRGAYDTTHNGGYDAFVSRLDPNKTGSAQLVYSTYLGGKGHDGLAALSVDVSDTVIMAGWTNSTRFPTTRGAFDTTFNGGNTFGGDVWVSRLDPSRIGSAQLVYSTLVGGSNWESTSALSVDANGVVTVLGGTGSANFPITAGAFDPSFNSGRPAPFSQPPPDVFLFRLDPRRVGTAQLVYSTFLGSRGADFAMALSVDARGVATMVGQTNGADYPTTTGAYDTSYNGGSTLFDSDVFVSRLDSRKAGRNQLVYSTFLGGSRGDAARALSVDASGVVTLAGSTGSFNFPTTNGAYDRTHNGGSFPCYSDAFVMRLLLLPVGRKGLLYSSFLGGIGCDYAYALSVDGNGVVTVAGSTASANFPTTRDAFDATHNGADDAFVSRLDLSSIGAAQLVYSTFLGGRGGDHAMALSVDASGVATVAGDTASSNFPATIGAFDTTYNKQIDGFLSRLDMGVALHGDTHEIPITTGGTQRLTVNAGKARKDLRYWIFGSGTGTSPGVNLLGVHVPLNPDVYTDFAIANVNSATFKRFRGTLDANGRATASFNVPANLRLPPGFTVHHAYVVYDASGKLYMASNAVPLRLR